MRKIDVSVILNIHREAIYLRPTLLSLEACINEAEEAGIAVELIAVFDHSDQATLDTFNSTPLTSSLSVKKIAVDVQSLGLARNAGIKIAEGEFIWTADADDLVSSNAIVQLIKTARSHAHCNVVVFVEFLVAFGERYHVVRYVGTEWLTSADFAYQHSYVSRIFVRRSAFSLYQYLDLKLTQGYAFEDWDFNCRLFASGYDFVIAPQTVFFYRQRSDSLLQQANALSAKVVPHSNLFEPKNYRKKNLEARSKQADWNNFIKERQKFFQQNFAQELLKTPRGIEFIGKAAVLDPEIVPKSIELSSSYCSIPWDPNHWGFQLEKFYGLIGYDRFDDIVLLPWLKPGGGEKYILQILEQINFANPKGRILVISGELASSHEWVNKLPFGTVFIDIFNAFPMLDITALYLMMVRALLAVSGQPSRLHLKASAFAHDFMDAYSKVLTKSYQIIYYRFADGHSFWNNKIITDNWGIKFLRRHLSSIDLVICDCKKIAMADSRYIGMTEEKYHTIYAQCTSDFHLPVSRPIKYRLLWASRISAEKRPELLRSIAEILSLIHPKLCIDVYGYVDAAIDISELVNSPRISYCGTFKSFSDLPIDQYDALLYTSLFDGLPNIVLEALECGLPVIAPDLGGISEAVIDGQTGYLVKNQADEVELIESYLRAIQRMYNNWEDTCAMTSNSMQLISERHSTASFRQRVIDVFKLQAKEGEFFL